MKKAIPIEVKRQVLDRDSACVYCGRPVFKVIRDDVPISQRWRAIDERGATFHFEHKVPLAAGGESTVENICLSCPECNLTKARTHDKKAARKGQPAMSRVIKVEEHVYDRLDQLRGKGGTFSEVVDDLLGVREEICQVITVIEGMIKFREWQAERMLRQQLGTDIKTKEEVE